MTSLATGPLIGPATGSVNRALLFGKMPAHGDFVSRGWSPAARDRLDIWLSTSLAAARDGLGADFDALGDAAPPWRCAIDDGDLRIAGALTPSQDSAGRRFPLFLALRDGGEDAAAACEALLYEAIGGGWSADALADRAATLPGGTDAAEGSRWWTSGGAGFAEAEIAGANPAALLATMLHAAETVR